MNTAATQNHDADTEKGKGPKDPGQSITITVVNEDNGREFELNAGKGTPVSTLIERAYEKLGVTRQGDDRLRCEKTNEDVFPFASIQLGQYLDAGHCPTREWLFAGGTGGALC